MEMQWWIPLLQRYWRRFEFWLPSLLIGLGTASSLSPPIHNYPGAWKVLRRRMGPVPRMTDYLVGTLGLTIFGRYRCHNPPTCER